MTHHTGRITEFLTIQAFFGFDQELSDGLVIILHQGIASRYRYLDIVHIELCDLIFDVANPSECLEKIVLWQYHKELTAPITDGVSIIGRIFDEDVGDAFNHHVPMFKAKSIVEEFQTIHIHDHKGIGPMF